MCDVEPPLWGKRHDEARGGDGAGSRHGTGEGTREPRKVGAEEMQGEAWTGREGKGSQMDCIQRDKKVRGRKLGKERPGVRGEVEDGREGGGHGQELCRGQDSGSCM